MYWDLYLPVQSASRHIPLIRRKSFLEIPARVELDAVSRVALGPAGQIYVLHRGEPLLLSFNKDWLDGVMPEQLASHPVFNVDWQDARAYCSWNTKRLPTEADWERAARGDLKGMDYPWGMKSQHRQWHAMQLHRDRA